MKLFILAVLPLIGLSQDPPPKDLPKTITVEDREKVKDLRIQAYDAALKVMNSERRMEEASKLKAEAQIDRDKAQRSLDEINVKIGTLTEELQREYDAPTDKWCITAKFTWVPKGDKPCVPQ